MRFSYNKLLFYTLLPILSFVSCKKFLDVGNPKDKIVAKAVYQSNASAAAVLTGIYFDLLQQTNVAQDQYGISAICGLSADELIVFPTNYGLVGSYTNNFGNTGFWPSLYNIVQRVNAAIEGLSNAPSLTPVIQQQLLGEARFIRAFCYFYLVNLYGDVPILTTSDYKVNAVAARSPIVNVYEQIIADLREAQRLLNDNYVNADAMTTVNAERIRPNKWVATALLARVYLYTRDWSAAAIQASMLIDNKSMYNIVPLNDVFLKNSQEAIWQLQTNYIPTTYTADIFNTLDAKVFVLEFEPDLAEHPFWMSPFLLNTFENGDQRKENWIGGVDSSIGPAYYFPFKYKLYQPGEPQNEYLMVLRLAEQYLIRAEARAQLGQLEESRLDLDVIRQRAGLNATTASTKDALLTVILDERQVELFTEWGHRWLDLKRTGQVNAVMTDVTPQKGGTWESFKQWYPLPFFDLQLNPNLKQNEGYSN